jgi:hypothetical protein
MDSNKKKRQTMSALTAMESQILEAIADRIWPRTNTAGAVEIGALDYIHRALRGDYARSLPLYRRGLRAVDRQARWKFGAKFTALEVEQKDAILVEFEAGEVSGFKKAAEFFETVRYHVLEGVFCEPQYGGNKDMIGWLLVGFPGQQFGYSDAYINRHVDLPPVTAKHETMEED